MWYGASVTLHIKFNTVIYDKDRKIIVLSNVNLNLNGLVQVLLFHKNHSFYKKKICFSVLKLGALQISVNIKDWEK